VAEEHRGAEVGKVRDRLAAERRRIAELIAETEEGEQEGSSELSTLDQHPAEIGTETADWEVALSLHEQLTGELADIDAAERRLDDGTYGLCEACGRPIDAARLSALPASRFCIEDQRLAEREAATGAVS